MSNYIEAVIAKFDGVNPTLVNLVVHGDNRGSFTELWKKSIYGFEPVQSNLSVNNKVGTFRGLHFQVFLPQAKLISVITGGIVDYIVDVRPKSKTFGKFAAFELVPGDSLLVPEGFAHGFLTTQDNTIVNYLVNGFRFEEHERIINALDGKIFSVDWITKNNSSLSAKRSLLSDIHEKVSDLGLSLSDLIMSDKDRHSLSLEELFSIDYNNFTHCIGTDLT